MVPSTVKAFDSMGYANIHDDCISIPTDFHADIYDRVIYPDPEQLTTEEFRRFFTDQGRELADKGEPSLDEFEDLINEIEESFIPITSWIWPIHISVSLKPQHLQAMLHLYAGPVCLIEVDGKYYLGLTGAGMDFSWDLCKAYMLAGNFPPAVLARHLESADSGYVSQDKLWIMQGSLHSLAGIRDYWSRQCEYTEPHFGQMITKDIKDVPPGMPLPVLHDWLLEHGYAEKASQVDAVLEALGYRKSPVSK